MSSDPIRALTPRASHTIDRLLDSPNLPAIVPRLDPRVLHQLVRAVGVEASGAFISLATPEQLVRVFDLDLWRREPAGQADRFDAERFGLWIDVLVEAGVAEAVACVQRMDPALVGVALSQHIAVCSRKTALMRGLLDTATTCDISGVMLVARREDAWDAIVALLIELEGADQGLFRSLMSTCRALSYEYLEEASGFDSLLPRREQSLQDLAFDRERRREDEGYVSGPEATAFLTEARRVDLTKDNAPSVDHLARSYFRHVDHQAAQEESLRQAPRADEAQPSKRAAAGETVDQQVAELVAALSDTERPSGRVRGLLPAGADASVGSHSHFEDYLASDDDPAVHARCMKELGYLANVLLEGGVLHDRPFTEHEAFEAAQAVCNLGLENWPSHWKGQRPDLVSAFQVGWTVLYEQVCLFSARRLASTLAKIVGQGNETFEDLQLLRRELTTSIASSTPWRARQRLDVIAILDTPSWSTLLNVINECPVVPLGCVATVTGSPRKPPTRQSTEFEFISDNRRVAWVHDFMDDLLERLS